MTPFDLIIFDCDGTLVDSEYLHNKVIADLLAALGLPQFTVEYNMRHFMGKGMEEAIALIEADGGRALPAAFPDDYVREVNARAAAELKVIDGVPETLARVAAAGLKICVASNGERDNVLGLIRAARLDTVFPDALIFTKSQVARPKPAPDLFLHAAETMGAAPARTLVIEDSVVRPRQALRKLVPTGCEGASEYAGPGNFDGTPAVVGTDAHGGIPVRDLLDGRRRQERNFALTRNVGD